MLKRLMLKPLLYLLSFPLAGCLYALQNHAKPRMHVLATALDRALPFIPAFSVFYALWYPFLFLTLFIILQRSLSQYYQTLAAIFLGMVLCNVIFFAYQTYVPRPEHIGTGLFSHLVRFVYAEDKPYNGFPSIHVLTCYLVARGSALLPRRFRWGVYGFSALIILSTLFIKQHVLADAAAGILLGEMVFRVTGSLLSLKPALFRPNGRQL